MKTFVIYFEDGSYYKCYADSQSEAITYAEMSLGFKIERNEVKILTY